MAEPLTYPPEILIESTVELPPEFGNDGMNEVMGELIGLAIEFVIELPFHLRLRKSRFAAYRTSWY